MAARRCQALPGVAIERTWMTASTVIKRVLSAPIAVSKRSF
jgi:hypothetical protein